MKEPNSSLTPEMRKMDEARSSLTPLPGPSSGLAIQGMKEELRKASELLSKERETYKDLNLKHNNLLKELRDSVECPVCLNIPRSVPIPCCRNGHIVCANCKNKCQNGCPTCRTPETNCTSQIAAKIIEHVELTCKFQDDGCIFMGSISDMQDHEDNCGYRIVRCPRFDCYNTTAAVKLTPHVIANGCAMNDMFPYKEDVIVNNEEDKDRNWKPDMFQFDNNTFYVQIEQRKSKNWCFYIQMEGSRKDCEKYGARIKVSKNFESDMNSIVYKGSVNSVDMKGSEEVEASGCGLILTHAALKKIFNFDLADPRRMFWLDVDIFKC